jgi:solute:Na+ symporter, SSS family
LGLQCNQGFGKMKLSPLDLGIIAIYLISVALLGFVLRRRAARSLHSYLMGDKELPWYFLGISNASGMFDISGTMWLVTIGFVMSLQSAPTESCSDGSIRY